MTDKRIVVLPDMQIPSHDPKAVDAVREFVLDYMPDELYCVGDEADSPEPSRWAKGTALEYAGTLQAGFDQVREVMAGFREVIGDKPFHVMRSNHGDRLRTYLSRYAPALTSLRDLTIEKQLGYDELNITYHDQMWEFSPGWVMAHGDEGNLVQTAGGTALSLARKVGKSIVCGHTHRFGMQHEAKGFNGQINQTLVGIEVGHLMDIKKASYLKTGAANWQQGFVILNIDEKKKVHPTLVPIINRSFIVEGERYAW